MSRPPILLIGAGGHARACIDVIEQEGRFQVHGLVGSVAETGRAVLGYHVLGSDDDLASLREQCAHALVVIGQIETPETRMRMFEDLVRLGYELPVIVSPRAYVSMHARLDAGTIVMHGAIVNAGARIGRNCIVNSRALIEHDVAVSDHCHISTGAVLNGGAAIGEGSFVGSGSVLREGITLGKRCLVGMGLSIRHDYPDQSRIMRVE